MAFRGRMRRVLRQLPRCALRDSEAHGKRFAPFAKVPQTYLQVLAGVRTVPADENFAVLCRATVNILPIIILDMTPAPVLL